MLSRENNQYLDSLLLQELQQNDEKALNYLFSTYYNTLYRTGLRLSHDHEMTQESIQEVFMDLWKYRQSLSAVQSFEAYLKASVKKRLSRKLGKQIDLDSLSIDSTTLSVESYEEILMIQEASNSRKKTLLKALDSLSQRQKEIILLKYFEELTYKEIADKTGLQVDSIYKILHEAIKALKGILPTHI